VVASPWSNANYVRSTLANALRSKNSYQVNLLVGGFEANEADEHPGPQLYFIDYMSSFARADFSLSTFQRYFLGTVGAAVTRV
jgi:20S proteasome subunit beta 4